MALTDVAVITACVTAYVPALIAAGVPLSVLLSLTSCPVTASGTGVGVADVVEAPVSVLVVDAPVDLHLPGTLGRGVDGRHYDQLTVTSADAPTTTT